MAFRTVAIRNPANLRIKSGQLVISGEQECSLPPEDIAVLLIESREVAINTYCLDWLSQHGVVTLICGDNHHPSTIVMPYLPHHKQTQISNLQITMSEPLKKRLWQNIIKSKISNQANCLCMLRRDGADKLHEYASQVLSGDSSGREALAAKYYFPRLFHGHYRNEDNVINDALNYSYSIIRAAIAREIVAKGFYPPWGLFHRSQSNQFNLVDDLIEPFRPIVDMYVAQYPPGGDYLTRDERGGYTAVLNIPCIVKNKQMSVLTAAGVIADSLVQSIKKKDHKLLKCPELILAEKKTTVRE